MASRRPGRTSNGVEKDVATLTPGALAFSSPSIGLTARGEGERTSPASAACGRENDNGDTTALPLQPSLIVESSPGKIPSNTSLASDHWPADEQGSAEHRAIEERMIESYGSDPNAKDLCRVLRVPGFLHRKDKNRPHLVRVVSSPGWRYPRQQIVDAFPPVESARQQAKKTHGSSRPYGEARER